MSSRIPKVWSLTERATLEFWGEDPKRGEQLIDIQLDTEQWFEWLQLATSSVFKFEPADPRLSNFMARKEARKGGDHWYAYKKGKDELYTRLLGASQDLTLARLREVGLQMQRSELTKLLDSEESDVADVNLASNSQLSQLEQVAQLTHQQTSYSAESQQLDQLKQEIQRLQDELANSHQSYVIACQEYEETIQKLNHQNQRLQTERDQLKNEIQHLYAKNGDLNLSLITRIPITHY